MVARKDKGYAVLFGEGVAPWKQLFDAGEHGGGIEYYLIEQEGSRFSEIETAQKCFGRVSRNAWRVADFVLFSNKMDWRIATRCCIWIALALLAPSIRIGE